jgi:hypothetical protein
MKSTIISIGVILLLLIGCNTSNEYNPNLLKPLAKNDYGELLFAVNKKYWKSDLGKTIKKSFEKLVKTTPLPYEKEFNIDFIVPRKLLKNLKTKNCILFIEIESYFPKKVKPIYKRDLWANGQLIVELKFNSENAAISYLKNNIISLKSTINEFYYEMIAKKLDEKNIINKELSSSLGLKYLSTKNLKLNKKEDNFWWFSELEITKDQNGSHEIQKGIFIYKYPYESEKQFEKQYQIRLRDSICKKHLRGKNEKTYMITLQSGLNETNEVSFSFNNKFCHEISGCWRMENDKMGGPFISISQLTKDRKYIITSSGYVYAPNFKKLSLLREMKSILYSCF